MASVNGGFEEFIGKKIRPNIDDIEVSVDIEENNLDIDENGNVVGGNLYCLIDYRPYLDETEVDNDADEDDDEDSYDEYSEESSWSLAIYMDISVDENGCISSITHDARIYAYGDSGIGDIYPDEYWSLEDYNKADDFLKTISE